MTGAPLEEEWERLGLIVLSSDADRALVLFASNDELQDFRARLDAYQAGAPPGQKHAPYNNFIAGIESIGSVDPRDRIGPRLREAGFSAPDDFVPQTAYLVDVELWDLGERRLRERKVEDVINYVEARAGEVLDSYVGPSISMFRAHLKGELIRTLLTIEEIAAIDLPPAPDVTTAEALDLRLSDVPQMNALADDAPLIGIIDSGVNDHPFLADIIAGAIAVPDDLGTADVWGHGTRVAGVAVFGDLRAQLVAGVIRTEGTVFSA
jgi:hypothetical protein